MFFWPDRKLSNKEPEREREREREEEEEEEEEEEATNQNKTQKYICVRLYWIIYLA